MDPLIYPCLDERKKTKKKKNSRETVFIVLEYSRETLEIIRIRNRESIS